MSKRKSNLLKPKGSVTLRPFPKGINPSRSWCERNVYGWTAYHSRLGYTGINFINAKTPSDAKSHWHVAFLIRQGYEVVLKPYLTEAWRKRNPTYEDE